MRYISLALTLCLPSWAAFPTVAAVGSSTTDTAATSHTVALGATPNTGDLLMCIFSTRISGTTTWPASWTQLTLDANGTAQWVEVRYKTASGEGSTISLTTSVGMRSAHMCLIFTTGTWSGTPEKGVAATGSSANPNPPSLTASWGADDNLWIAYYGAPTNGDTTAYPTTYPDNRTNIRAAGNGGTGVVSGMATLSSNTATSNPGTFTNGNSAAWVANTIVVQPAGGGGSTLKDMIGRGIIPVAR